MASTMTAPDGPDAEDAALFSAFTISATIWLLITTAVGLLLSFKFIIPGPRYE